jgi:predicted nucleotidyltransferase
MNDTLHKPLSGEERQAVITAVGKTLEAHADISFAYLHGSFLTGSEFRDVDVAVYLNELPAAPLDYELQLETELPHVVHGFPVDVRILNNAPLSFKYNVIKSGVLLFARDDDERADFVESTLSAYFDFAPYRALYLKETLGLGV